MPTVAKFRKAQRLQCYAAIMIQGLSGKGKSGLALSIGHALAHGNWGKVYTIDTENRSLDLYSDTMLHTGQKVHEFNTVDLTPEDGYRPTNYAALRDAAIEAGGEVVIMDSITHMWRAKGGVLDMVATLNNRNSGGNKYAVWNDENVVKEKNAIAELIRDSRAHIITTVRVKEKMEIVKNDAGKTEIKSLGEQQIQMDDLKYEPDLVLDMIRPGKKDGTPPRVRVIKSRYAIFEPDQEYDVTADLLEQLRVYLEEGADPDELLKQQHADYVGAVKDFLDADPANRKPIWDAIKEMNGMKDKKLADIPLNTLKVMYSTLIK